MLPVCKSSKSPMTTLQASAAYFAEKLCLSCCTVRQSSSSVVSWALDPRNGCCGLLKCALNRSRTTGPAATWHDTQLWRLAQAEPVQHIQTTGLAPHICQPQQHQPPFQSSSQTCTHTYIRCGHFLPCAGGDGCCLLGRSGCCSAAGVDGCSGWCVMRAGHTCGCSAAGAAAPSMAAASLLNVLPSSQCRMSSLLLSRCQRSLAVCVAVPV